ncbi:thioredoxin fold domain-containing protein [Fulvivirgaceae bacterium BMA10]|uniref:Thioredoxin fold domain-containing protein n=1 Tax=Splendidivirga corallicola TaxID=3051826 RepID=A0ABT8KQ11_9BACT|nr:thioredoxin fold domain-containing protein [Fulvivirgaceae bacterium BMA10]
MIRHLFISITFLLLGNLTPEYSLAQLNTFSFADIDSLNRVEKREVVVFIHTDWCKYCHKMQSTTFKNDKVIALLNDHFYFISLNAETKQDITYQGYTFKFKPTGGNTGVHEIAEQLGTIEGKLNYPTISILNEKNEIVFQYDGLMKSNELSAVLNELNK